MAKLSKYIGSAAFGIKMGLVLPGSNILEFILSSLEKVDKDGLLSNGDVVCVTESVVARSQNNYVTVTEASEEIRKKCSVTPKQAIGVVFPIISRNRFALILKSIAQAVSEGRVIVQLSYPADEVGNQVIPYELCGKIEKKTGKYITSCGVKSYLHPLTGTDYIKLYRETIRKKGADANILLCNNPLKILDYKPDAVIVSNIHNREETKHMLQAHNKNVITLQDLFNDDKRHAWSEWGLLGSNMSSDEKLKLAPRQSDKLALEMQALIYKKLKKKVEIIIYGDGAYKDPSSGIYELADPCSAFGVTPGIENMLRTGIKLKYLIDMHHERGKTEKEIRDIVKKETAKKRGIANINAEGTTPRKITDVLATLADLVSGSADTGTPIVLIKGFFPSSR